MDPRNKPGGNEERGVTTALDDYLRDPREITRRSFAIVRAETDLSRFPEDIADIALRVVHACGMPEIAGDLAFGGDLVGKGRRALEAGAPVLADCAMVADGVTRARLPADNPVLCTLNDPRTPDLARDGKTTRSAAAVDLWRDDLEGSVVAIGNAPTALFRLLELLRDGAPRPAAILAFPVGFVGAAESKEALVGADLGVPYLTLRGRRGGSAMAAAAVNALARAGL
ncbi:precorrin-8X methylmutase [Pelagibius sp.]|uniref:precorrin-8X methylmutase n=1 Tax=Pelagibius sp. TaxID=1931238 RepID=UPI00261C1B0D|nr:precorrin-8X methylmutase [Pelagibius sp.]